MQPSAVVVVNYGTSSLLAVNLAAIHAGLPESHVVVVDNHSSDEERDRVAALCGAHGWELVAADNLGFGHGVRLGVEAARRAGARDFLVINPDATIDRRSAESLVAAVAADPMLLASPVVRRPDGSDWFHGLDLYLVDGFVRGFRRRAEHADEPRIEWLSGACLMLTDALWDATGGFDDDYFLYWEDVDFSTRVQACGGSVGVVEAAVAVHDEGQSTRVLAMSSEAKSSTYYYYNIRNHLLYASKHLDASGIRRWRRSSLRHAKTVLLRGGRRQFLRPVGPLTAASRGLRDGRAIARRALRDKATWPSHEGARS